MEKIKEEICSSTFSRDVLLGLTQEKKAIPSKYLYDDIGCQIFNKITRLPDYYLTDCEIEILKANVAKILGSVGSNEFNLIELGPGEGIKTLILLEYCIQQGKKINYIPMDISTKYLEDFSKEIAKKLPVKIFPLQNDYVNNLEGLNNFHKHPNLVLFLGSSIGNFPWLNTKKFLKSLHANLNNNDYVLIGFDLKKDIAILLKAYDDQSKLTRDFNLNLLRRINRELGGHFDPKTFYHYATYNVYSGAMESYLVSLESQSIKIDAFDQIINLQAFEAIHVEFSFKYLLSQILELAHDANFEVVEQFQDTKGFFVNSLWRVKK